VLEAFVWVRSTLAAGKPAGTAPDPIVSTPEISRALHPVFPAVRLLADADQVAAKRRQTGKINPEGQAQLKLAIDESDGPALALLFGEVGLARGDEQGAIAAANRALDLAPGYPGALTVLARASVGLGKLDQLDAVVDKLPADQTRGLKAFSAYEQGKLADLTKLAQGLTDATDPGGLVRVRLQRLRGNAPIPDAALERLMKADAVGGDLCAVDAWLDAGDLARARAVVETWPDAATHPLRASRLARLLRYEGKDREASSALGAAAPGRAVLVERIILAADSASGAEQALSLVDERLGPERPFWQAFAHAKKGEGDKAASFLDAAQPPSFDAQLSLRIAAALAYAEAKDARGEPVVRVLLEGFPKNPDVQRAARALDIQPERR
jgi:hypothetical protein